MTQSSEYKSFLNGMQETEIVSQFLQETKGGINPTGAEKELKGYALNFLSSHPSTQNLVPQNFDQLPPEQQQEIIQIGTNMGIKIAHEKAMRAMDSNLENIVDKDLSEDTLSTLLFGTKEISSRIADADQEVAAKFIEFKRYDEFMRHYENAGKPRNQTEEALVMRAAIRGYAEKEGERMKEFSQEVQQLARAFAARAFRHSWRPESTAEYAKPGLKVQAEEKKKEYDEMVKKGRSVASIARDAIKSIKKPEDQGGLASTAREKLYGAIYRVGTGKIKFKAPTFADYASAGHGELDMQDELLN